MGCISSKEVPPDGGVGYLLSPKQAASLAKFMPEEEVYMEKHAAALCADSGPSSGGPSPHLLIRVMAISVGSAKRRRSYP